MEQYADVMIDPQGNVVANALVPILDSQGVLAKIFQSNSQISPAANPIRTGSLGEFAFYARNGRYRLGNVSVGDKVFPLPNREILLYDPTDDVGGIPVRVDRLESSVEQLDIEAAASTQALDALQLPDYAALRAYKGPRKSVYVTGAGIAGMFVRDDADTASADNGGTVIVAAGKRFKRVVDGAVNVRWFGVIGDGVANDTAAMQSALDYLATAACSHLDATGLTIRLTDPVTLRASQKIIEGKRAKVILASSTAGFRIAGQANKFSGFKFSQASQADTPTAIYVFNDTITNNSSYTLIEECEGENVYRGVHFYMGITGAGAAAYRHTVKGCRFVKNYLPKGWPGSFGIAFDGANPGDSAGNDSHVLHSYVKGYENNYVVHNSVATAFVQCSGDGAGALGCFKYSGNSSGLRLIGGYYEYNDTLIFCSDGAKYDAYLLYPSVANTVNAQITGDGITFLSGGWSIGTASQLDIKNGAYKTTTSAVAEVWAANGFQLYSHKDKILRMSVDNAGTFLFDGTFAFKGLMSVDTIRGYTGGGTPLKIVLTSASTLTRLVFGTNSTERWEVPFAGDFQPVTDNSVNFGSAAKRAATAFAYNLNLKPPASATPANNGEMTFELTSNTQLQVKVKGSDGVVRSAALTLA